MPYVQQANAARLVLDVSVGAFIVGELSQVLRVRCGATRTNLGAEALFRVMFFGGILLIPIGRAVAPDAVIRGGVWLFCLGVLPRATRGSVLDNPAQSRTKPELVRLSALRQGR